MLAGIIDVAGKGCGEIIGAAGGVGDEVLAPAIPDMAPRIGEAIGDVDVEFLRLGLITENAAFSSRLRAIRRLDLGVMEVPFIEVQVAARAPAEIVNRVMGVGTIESRENDLLEVGFACTLGILEEDDVRLLTDVGTAVAERDARRQMEAIGEDGRLYPPCPAPWCPRRSGSCR